jgi:ribonuclease Z
LPVTGPTGTAALVDRTVTMLRDDIAWRVAHHDDLEWGPSCDVHEVDDGVAWEANNVRVVAAPTEHRPVQPTVGYRVEHDGKAVVIAGDTMPCTGVDLLCAGADVYVQTVIRPDLVQAVPSARLQDILDYHSSVEQAAATATRGGVGTLVLTHYVPPMQPGTEDEWRARAATEFAGTIELGDDLHTVRVG